MWKKLSLRSMSLKQSDIRVVGIFEKKWQNYSNLNLYFSPNDWLTTKVVQLINFYCTNSNVRYKFMFT